MKKIRLFIIAIISLLLPSCSNTPSPSLDNNVVSGETEKLNDYIYIPPEENISDSNNVKFPVGGKIGSGEFKSGIDENLIITDEIMTEDELIEDQLNNRPEAGLHNEISDNIIVNQDPNKELLATYSSKVYTKTEDRQKNLRIVCDKLSGTILAPNEEFSYNDTCGPYNKENGFGKATVFLGDGTEMQDYGGGVCQLSSTLYNAVKDLNVDVTERHNHSKKVYYVPDGQDATVSYGNLDFKFKNLNNYSLLFEATSNAQSVDVNVYKI